MKRNLNSLIYGCGFVLLLVFSCFGQNNPPPSAAALKAADLKTADPILDFGQTVEREMAGGARHDYKIKLAQGQFVRIEAEQGSCDLIFALYSYAGDGNVFDVTNSSPDGLETGAAAIEKSGDYNLQVVSMNNQKGVYKLKIAELRTATAKELNLTAGVVLLNSAFLKTTSSSTTGSILKGIAENESALEKFRLADAKDFESRALNNIGGSYNKLGNVAKAIEYYEKALQISNSIEDKYEIALNLSNLGTAYQLRGDWPKSFEALLKSLALRREIKNVRGEALSLNKIGCFLRLAGDANRALEYFQLALGVIQKNNLQKNFEADTLENFGMAYLSLGEFEKARESFQKALEIAKITPSRRREAAYLSSLGKSYFLLGDTQKALQMLDESFKISDALDDKLLKAAVLKNLGQIQLTLGETDKSLAALRQSLEISRIVEDGQNLAETLLLAAKAENKKGNSEAAQIKTEEAIMIIEKIRSRVQAVELRDSFSANLQDYYAFYIELLMTRHKLAPDKNFAALALQANERARARGLLNLLAESNTDIRQGGDPKLLEKEIDLKNLLAARLENLTKLLNGKSNAEQTAKLKNEIEQIRAEYEQAQSQIRAASPHYAALTQPKTLSLAEIRSEVLDSDSVLLEYALGETKSYLWIVTKDNFQTIELPAKSEIEKTARAFYESMTARNKTIKFETAEELGLRITQADAELQQHSKVLSRMIIAPAMEFVANKRLLIVADGALQYIPFAALIISNPKIKEQFLIENNEIVSLPSASTLAVLRRETRNRSLAPKTLAIFADPVFDKNDERLRSLIGDKNKTAPPKVRIENIAMSKNLRQGLLFTGDSDSEGSNLERLRFTRREAELISSLVPANQRQKLLDFQANRQAVFSAKLSDYRYIHFATHSFINNQNPELSGIVFSLIDENGKEQDGVLRINEVFNLKLPVEMVVLSGCRTGLGKEIKGEGLVGLTRGFMYAGAKRVTVSLWDVNDEATSELMTQFYREMFGAKRLAPTAALRQAQISMLKDKRWNNPYFWATFVLQGEPKY